MLNWTTLKHKRYEQDNDTRHMVTVYNITVNNNNNGKCLIQEHIHKIYHNEIHGSAGCWPVSRKKITKNVFNF